MAIKCPACRQRTSHQVARSEYDPVAPQFVGGIVMAFVFVLSRKRRFRCDHCGELFYAHTIGSRIWLVLWIWFVLSVAFAIIFAMLTSVGKR